MGGGAEDAELGEGAVVVCHADFVGAVVEVEVCFIDAGGSVGGGFGKSAVVGVVGEAEDVCGGGDFDGAVEGIVEDGVIFALNGVAVGIVEHLVGELKELVGLVAFLIFGKAAVVGVVGVGVVGFGGELVEGVVGVGGNVCLEDVSDGISFQNGVR